MKMNSLPLNNITDISSEELTNQASDIINSLEKKWTEDKKYSYKLNKLNCDVSVKTYHKDKLNNDYWAARVSSLDELGAADKKEYHSKLVKYIIGSTVDLEQTHTEHEKQYIHELVDYDLKPITLPPNRSFQTFSYLTKLEYKFPFPLNRRVFYELIHVCQSLEDSSTYIISLAIDPRCYENKPTKMVHARYTSIEKIHYDDFTNKLQWVMCTCSSPGGSIPGWLSKLSINSAIAKDVPSFMNWADSI